MLIAVDDVQWLDPSSARILSFAARRLGEVPVGILVTQRGDGPDPLDLANALGVARHAEIRLGPLSLGALAHLVRSRRDVPLPRPVLARVHEASGGNPMFALEFARSFGQDRPQLGPIAIPSSLLELVAPASSAARRRSPRARDRRRRGAPHPVNARGRRSGRAGAARRRGRPGRGRDRTRSRPLHPSAARLCGLRRARADRETLSARASWHSVCEDVEERARHLALAAAEPDPSAAAVLDEAAARAAARGAPEAAAELAQEALRLTPSGEDSQRFERTLGAVWRLAGAGRFADARELLDRLLADSPEGPRRARALLTWTMLADDVDEGAAADRSAGPRRRGSAAARQGSSAAQLIPFLPRGSRASDATARQALAAAEEAGDEPLVAAALLAVADRADLAGCPEPDARRACDGARRRRRPSSSGAVRSRDQ